MSEDLALRNNALLAGVAGRANIGTHGNILLAVDCDHSEAVGIPDLGESRWIPRGTVIVVVVA